MISKNFRMVKYDNSPSILTQGFTLNDSIGGTMVAVKNIFLGMSLPKHPCRGNIHFCNYLQMLASATLAKTKEPIASLYPLPQRRLKPPRSGL